MLYSNIVATIAIIVSISAVPASGYFSYKYAINGEKRKEFNAVADVLRHKLRRHKEAVLLNSPIKSIGDYERLKDEDYEALYDRAYPRRFKVGLVNAWALYKSTESSLTSKHPNGVNFAVLDKDRMISVIEAIEAFCQRK